MNLLDLVVAAVIIVSALFALLRGFVKEALSIGAWVGAGLVALYGYPVALPVAQRYISVPVAANAAAVLVPFIASLVVFSLLTAVIARQVQQSSLSALDRSLGFLFGAVRGLLLACLGWIALTWLMPEPDWPDWVRQARTRPLLANGADSLRALVPEDAKRRGVEKAEEARRAIDQAREAERAMRALSTPTTRPPAQQQPSTKPSPAPSSGYKPTERREMDRLFQSTQ